MITGTAQTEPKVSSRLKQSTKEVLPRVSGVVLGQRIATDCTIALKYSRQYVSSLLDVLFHIWQAVAVKMDSTWFIHTYSSHFVRNMQCNILNECMYTWLHMERCSWFSFEITFFPIQRISKVYNIFMKIEWKSSELNCDPRPLPRNLAQRTSMLLFSVVRPCLDQERCPKYRTGMFMQDHNINNDYLLVLLHPAKRSADLSTPRFAVKVIQNVSFYHN